MKCMKNIFLVFTLLCCSFSLLAQNKIPTVSINPKGMETAKTRLSDLIQSIKYIPLETNENCLIQRYHIFDVSSRYILLYATLNNIYLFDRSGRFITEIGKRGLGPGEYYSISNLSINEGRNQVALITGVQEKRKIQRYDLKGKILSEVPLREDIGVCLGWFGHYGIFLTREIGGKPTPPYTFTLRDREKLNTLGKGVKTTPIGYIETGSASGSNRPIPYVRNGNMYIRETSLNDTLYKITSENIFTPYYVIDAGKYKITTDLRKNPERFIERMHEFVSFSGAIFEMDKAFLISYYFEKKSYFLYYDKTTRQSALFPSEKGIPNDWDGGPDIWFTRQDEKTMYGFIPASEFLEHKNKLTPKGPQSAIKRMNELKETLLEDDNPVFVVVTMK